MSFLHLSKSRIVHLSEVACAEVSMCVLGGTARLWCDRVKKCGLRQLGFGSAEYNTSVMF